MMVPPGAVPMVQPSIGAALKLRRGLGLFGGGGGGGVGLRV